MANTNYPTDVLQEVETTDDTNPIIYYNPNFEDEKYKSYDYINYSDCACMKKAQDKSSCVNAICGPPCEPYNA